MVQARSARALIRWGFYPLALWGTYCSCVWSELGKRSSICGTFTTVLLVVLAFFCFFSWYFWQRLHWLTWLMISFVIAGQMKVLANGISPVLDGVGVWCSRLRVWELEISRCSLLLVLSHPQSLALLWNSNDHGAPDWEHSSLFFGHPQKTTSLKNDNVGSFVGDKRRLNVMCWRIFIEVDRC